MSKALRELKNAMPHGPIIWCTTKISTDFARSTTTFIRYGLGPCDSKQVSLHHGSSWTKTKSRVVALLDKLLPSPVRPNVQPELSETKGKNCKM